MHIWTLENWKKFYPENSNVRHGLRLRFDTDIDPEVKRALKEFGKWLRTEFYFPIRIPVYVKAQKKIKAKDGEMVYGTFFEPCNRYDEPYIRIAAGDYPNLLNKWDKDNALASNLSCLAHELTHYFQWINALELTDIGRERQATKYASYILSEYSETREHP